MPFCTLQDGITGGANLSLSSAGSAADVRNVLDAGITWANFLNIRGNGIENNTALSLVSDDSMLQYLPGWQGNNADWRADLSDLLSNTDSYFSEFLGAKNGKQGVWDNLTLSAIKAETTGDINLTGVSSLKDAELKGRSVSLGGMDGQGLALYGGHFTATGGDISLTGTADADSGKNGVDVKNAELNAGTGNLKITGTAANNRGISLNSNKVTAKNMEFTGTSGNWVGIRIDSGEYTASGDITLKGQSSLNPDVTDGDASPKGIYITKVGDNDPAAKLSAAGSVLIEGSVADKGVGIVIDKNSVIESTSQGGSNSVKLTGLAGAGGDEGLQLTDTTVTVTSGDILIDGTAESAGKSGAVVKNGSLTASGKLELTGKGTAAAGGALKVSGTALSAANAVITGISLADDSAVNDGSAMTTTPLNSGMGFVLDDKVTLDGGIADGANLTLSSAGSAADVRNTLGPKVSLSNFTTLQKAGIENDTSVTVDGNGTAPAGGELGWTDGNSDWTFSPDTLKPDVNHQDKTGKWDPGLTNFDVTTTGKVDLHVREVTDSNIKGGSLALNGLGTLPLEIKNTSLEATADNVSIQGAAVSLVGGVAGKTVKATQGITVKATGRDGGGNALTVQEIEFSSATGTTLDGKSDRNNAGVKLAGNIKDTTGALTVTGTANRVGDAGNVRGIDARDATIETAGTLAMDGRVTGTDGEESSSVVGLDLSGNNTVLKAMTANLTGVSEKNGYGFLLNADLQGGLATPGNLTLSSKDSGSNVVNRIDGRVDSAVVKHMVEQHISIGSYTDTEIADMYTQKDFDSWITDGNLTHDFGDFGLKFSNINISTGSINLKGASFTGSSSLEATSGDLVIDNKGGRLALSGTPLKASGNIILKGGKSTLSGQGDLNAGQNISITGSKGGVDISGRKTITSSTGNITINGDAVGFNSNGVKLNNVDLTATQGRIDVTGDTAAGSGWGTGLRGGIYLDNDVNFISKFNTLYGHNEKGGYLEAGGIAIFQNAHIKFSGNTSVKGENDKSDSGIIFSPWDKSDIRITFEQGENYSVDGSGGSGMSVAPRQFSDSGGARINFIIDGGTLELSGHGTSGYGITGAGNGYFNANGELGYVFSGAGDVNVKGTAVSGVGVEARVLNNKNLAGKFTITGESESGKGVWVTPGYGRLLWDLQNATITGSSVTGDGINLEITKGRKFDLNGNTMKGRSGTGTGINIHGSKVSLNNGILDGESGSGDGVVLEGGKDYTMDGATVNGRSVSGTGVKVGGHLFMKNSLVDGQTESGTGVYIGDDLQTSSTTIHATASGPGTGAVVKGAVTGDDPEKNLIYAKSAQGEGAVLEDKTSVVRVTIVGEAEGDNGNGLFIPGHLTTREAILEGRSANKGTGVKLADGSVVDGGHTSRITGYSRRGTGVDTGKSTLSGVIVKGITVDGTGVDASELKESRDGTVITGEASGHGVRHPLIVPLAHVEDMLPSGHGGADVLRQRVYETQSVLSHERQIPAVYSEAVKGKGKPVDVEICVFEHCDTLHVGLTGEPSRS